MPFRAQYMQPANFSHVGSKLDVGSSTGHVCGDSDISVNTSIFCGALLASALDYLSLSLVFFDVSGNLCISQSWPGQARTLYGDHERFVGNYFSQFPGRYVTGDGCKRDEDGYYWITGRVDDVLNVSGHRLGTAEIESALVAHDDGAVAAVVGFPHEIKGQGVFAFVVSNRDVDVANTDELVYGLRHAVRESIGPIATPDHILCTTGLPKTRSGKIMRRILRSIAARNYDDLGDVSTLADPSVVKEIVQAHIRMGR